MNIRRLTISISAAALCLNLALLVLGQAQTAPEFLQSGKSIERSIKVGETHSYQIKLAAGQFLRAEVVQPNVGVEVKFFDATGKELNIVNNFGAFAFA